MPVRAVRAFKLSLLASFCIGEYTLNGELRENDLNPIIRQLISSNYLILSTPMLNLSCMNSLIFLLKAKAFAEALRRISSPRTKLLAARCECLHLIKINCLALWLDESAHACTRSELRGASCEEWKSAFKPATYASKVVNG